MTQIDGSDRLRVTLLDRMSAVESGRSSLTGLTLDAVLRADKRGPPLHPPPPPQLAPASPARNHSNRTLLDIMREEQRHGHSRDKTTWKSFREKLRLKRDAAAAAWTSSNPIPSSDTPIPAPDTPIPPPDIPIQDNESQRSNRLGFLLSNSENVATRTNPTHHQSNADASDRADRPAAGSFRSHTDEPVDREGRLRLGVVLAEERALSAREAEAAATVAPPPPEVQPPRMSLMDLLEETDQQTGVVGTAYAADNEEEEEEEEETDVAEEKDGGGGGGGGAVAEESSCCVCMIRSKGAAFIPCGHTFCRLCSRELWVQRGNCPLCNASILEILDIF